VATPMAVPSLQWRVRPSSQFSDGRGTPSPRLAGTVGLHIPHYSVPVCSSGAERQPLHTFDPPCALVLMGCLWWGRAVSRPHDVPFGGLVQSVSPPLSALKPHPIKLKINRGLDSIPTINKFTKICTEYN
jgi:hypothetical protein